MPILIYARVYPIPPEEQGMLGITFAHMVALCSILLSMCWFLTGLVGGWVVGRSTLHQRSSLYKSVWKGVFIGGVLGTVFGVTIGSILFVLSPEMFVWFPIPAIIIISAPALGLRQGLIA